MGLGCQQWKGNRGPSVNTFVDGLAYVPPSFSSIGLYSRTSKLQLPPTSVVEEFKVVKTRRIMTLKDSKDGKVRNAVVQIRTGRKWSASKAMEDVECRLRHKDIVGIVCRGSQGLGTSKGQRWNTADIAERRGMVQGEIRHQEEAHRKTRAVEMVCQGALTLWNTEERKLPWQISGDIPRIS